MSRRALNLACTATLLLIAATLHATQTIRFEPTDGDMTLVVRKALESVADLNVKLVFSKGTYRFTPDYAVEKYCFITNHDNGLKKIAFPLLGFKSVEIVGNGSDFIFHGQILPFLFEGCDNVSVKDLTIDWDIPFCFQGEVVAINEEEGWRDINPFTQGFSWVLRKDHLVFPNIDGVAYAKVGATLAFDPDTKEIAFGATDFTSQPTKVEKLKGGVLRFHEKMKKYPPVGSILHSKGKQNRYAPAFHGKSSSNLMFDGIVIHHALGMGWLMERCENVTIRNGGVYVREGSDRVASIIADGTHFCGCKGSILVENCRFLGMLDDSTNCHGTYVEVDEVLSEERIRVQLKHFQQLGYEFAGAGDEVWFIQQPDPRRGEVNTVTSVEALNDRFIELTFEKPVPAKLQKGDVVENKTWNPTFTMRGCDFGRHRARNIVLKTPLPIVIEDCDFASMMSSIFFRGETYYWFESGNVEDVLIRNNRFKDCVTSGGPQAILRVTPRLGPQWDVTIPFDRNIRFIDNTIETFDNRIVWLDRVDGLLFKGNTIKQTTTHEPHWPDAHLFDFTNCRNIQITDNTYIGNHTKTILADSATKPTLRVEGNKGF